MLAPISPLKESKIRGLCDLRRLNIHLTKCFRATAGALVSQVKTAVSRARATASARALDRARLNTLVKFLRKGVSKAKFTILLTI